jgi:hypothetical protein
MFGVSDMWNDMTRPQVADGGEGLKICRVTANILKSSCGQPQQEVVL